MSHDLVRLGTKRNRGWPYPEPDAGMDPMYGEDGWCRTCGTPGHAQTGTLELQRGGLTDRTGAWVPNWQFDTLCLHVDVKRALERDFDLELRPVHEPKGELGDVWQLVIPVVGDRWFATEVLEEGVKVNRDGTLSMTCAECGTFRWNPMREPWLPMLEVPELADVDVAASPEWFGSGMNSFHELLFRRELAAKLAAASPRDFAVTG